MSADDWAAWSLAHASQQLRTRTVGAVELVDAMLERIGRIDADVRSFVTTTPELARRHARLAQRRLDRDPETAPPLTGVPVALKDLFDVRGCRTTAGSRVLADNVAVDDSQAWRRLRRAGAVLLGKTNTHEFAYGGTTEPTRNPWDLRHMVGGSSGGSAAALAAGLCFGALGTDTAGSVRIPAGFCGVSGLKTTNGALSLRGVIPLAPSLDCVGPMARDPRDVALLYAALKTGAASPVRALPGIDSLHELTVGVLAHPNPVSPGSRQAVVAAAGALMDAHVTVLEVRRPDLQPHLDPSLGAHTNFTIMAAQAGRYHRHWLRTCPEKYSDYVRTRLEKAMVLPAVDYLDALEQQHRLESAWDAAFDTCDVLLLNGMPCVAPAVGVETIDIDGQQFDRDWLMCRDTAFANVTGHPALAVPAGLHDGLPVGVQLVARRGQDSLLFAPGQAIFDRLGHDGLAPEPGSAGR